MNPWLVVLGIWTFMLVVALAVARWAEHRPDDEAVELDEDLQSVRRTNAAWKELDTHLTRYGAGHPLQ